MCTYISVFYISVEADSNRPRRYVEHPDMSPDEIKARVKIASAIIGGEDFF